MLINRSTTDHLFRGFRTEFYSAYDAALTSDLAAWTKIATLVRSNNASEEYRWFKSLPGMTEWISDRVFASLEEQAWEIKNKHWQEAVEVSKTDIRRGRVDTKAALMRYLGHDVALHPNELVANLLTGGFGATGYDGQYFFDTDHPVGNGTVSNKATGALSATNLEAAIIAFENQLGDNGKPMNIRATHLVVGPGKRFATIELLKNEFLANGQNNKLRGAIEVIEMPLLVGTVANNWFLLDLSKPIRAVIVQIETAPEFASQDKPDDENAFMRNIFRYGVDYWGNAGYGLWQLAYGSTGAS